MYVDDILLTGTDKEEIEHLKSFLHSQIKIKDLRKLNYFWGLKILYTDTRVLVSQKKLDLDLLGDYHCSQYSSVVSPLDTTIKLKANEGKPISDPSAYRKLVGKLNFLTNTRLDVGYGVQHLSQFMQDLREPHLQAVFHMLRYLNYGVQAFCDLNWAACPNSRKS